MSRILPNTHTYTHARMAQPSLKLRSNYNFVKTSPCRVTYHSYLGSSAVTLARTLLLPLDASHNIPRIVCPLNDLKLGDGGVGEAWRSQGSEKAKDSPKITQHFGLIAPVFRVSPTGPQNWGKGFK